jgi:peptidoglycan/LPS O-acetylase OafA/YrhL
MSFKTRLSLFHFADLGVQFFFVISGFLITSLLIKEKVKKGDISLRNFYVRRIFRIVPVAYLYLFFILLLDVVLNLHLNKFLLLTSFLFLRNFFRTASGVNHLTTHYWSLAVEEQFYLAFPVVLKKTFKGFIFLIFGIIGASLLVDLLTFCFGARLDANAIVRMVVLLATQFQGIAVGSLTAVIVFKANCPLMAVNKTLLNCSLLLAIILLTLYGGPFTNAVNMLKCLLFAAILVLNLSASDNVIFGVLNHGAMKLIGVLSYSLYIWQQPFTQGLTFINQSKVMSAFDNKIPIDIAFTFVLLISLALITYASYFYFERTFLRLRDRYR